MRCLFIKLDTNVLVLLFSWAPGPPTPLSILVSASLRSSVNGVVHSVVRELQFIGNFSHGIAFISQNKNRLTSFIRNVFVAGHFEPETNPQRLMLEIFKMCFISPLFNQVGQLRTFTSATWPKIKRHSATQTTTQSYTWNKQMYTIEKRLYTLCANGVRW